MISKFFIEHPIFANVIALVTVIVGGVFLYGLPVAQYPEIVPPTIQVSTRYPGASAEVVASTIGVPLEQSINGVENSIYMSSTSSSDGTYALTITFDVGTDLDTSLALVQNLANTALADYDTSKKFRIRMMTGDHGLAEGNTCLPLVIGKGSSAPIEQTPLTHGDVHVKW